MPGPLASHVQHPVSLDDSGSFPVVKKRLSLFTSLKLTDREGERLRVLLLFLFAFLLRFLFLNEIASHPLFDSNLARGTDMKGYIDWASRITEGDWLGRKEGAFWQGPLFPYFLAVLFTLFGKDLFLATLVQMLLSAFTCVLIYSLGKALFSKKVGVLAALMASCYSLFIFFGAVLHSTTLEVFMTAAMLLHLTYSSQHPKPTNWLLSGALIGLACLARPNLLLFPPFLPLALRFRLKGERDFRLRQAIVMLLLGMVLVIAPVTLRNYMFSGRFVLVSAAGPETFRIANSFDSVPLNFVYPKLPQMPILSWPFLRHQLRKAVLFWWGYEAPQNVNYYFFREFSQVLKLPLLPFWLVAPLGLLGLALSFSRWRRFVHLYAFVVSYYLSIVIFFIIARFRLPLMPALIVFAAFALSTIYDGLLQWRKAVIGYASLAIILALTMRPYTAIYIYPNDYGMLGYILANRGEYGRAIGYLTRAAEGLPSHPGLNHDLGVLLTLEGHYEEAVLRFERELFLNPRNASAHRALGILYLNHKKDPQRALGHLRRFLELEPEGARADQIRQSLEALERSMKGNFP
ncbi:MAG: glycosyltransferase family 39 protein [Candidatus Methylomirabilales bacterium]